MAGRLWRAARTGFFCLLERWPFIEPGVMDQRPREVESLQCEQLEARQLLSGAPVAFLDPPSQQPPSNEFVVTAEQVQASGIPIQARMPQTYGYDTIRFAAGDYQSAFFQPLEPAVFVGDPGAVLGGLQISNVDGASFDGFEIRGTFQIRDDSDNNLVTGCKFSCETATPIRIRFGSDGNTIERCLIKRANISTPEDVTGIYLSDGPNINNTIRECEIIDYTDAIQVGFRNNTDYGFAAGLTIESCTLGVSSQRHNADGSMSLGLENCLDFKSGGTPENPVVVVNNVLTGTRPNASTPGYAVTFHKCATDFLFMNNQIVDCEAGYQLTAQYVNNDQSLGWQDPRLRVEGDRWDVRNHGFASFWAKKQGAVICGSNSGLFINCQGLNYDKLEEMRPNAAAEAREVWRR
jgi:hypothetical protein